MTAVDDRPDAKVPELGQARKRKEDARLITGRTRWTDNIVLPGMLHLAFVRSPFAHATITSIDTEAAKASPNVVAIYTGKDLDEEQGSLPCAWPITSRRASAAWMCSSKAAVSGGPWDPDPSRSIFVASREAVARPLDRRTEPPLHYGRANPATPTHPTG